MNYIGKNIDGKIFTKKLDFVCIFFILNNIVFCAYYFSVAFYIIIFLVHTKKLLNVIYVKLLTIKMVTSCFILKLIESY